jgi:hypothetical protein
MADTNATRMGFQREATAGVIPNPFSLQRLRYTGAPDLGQTPNVVESEEILDSGELTDTALVSVDVGGSVNIEFSHESYDDLLEAAMRGTYSAKRELRLESDAVGDMDITAPNVIISGATAGLIVGDIVYLDGFVNAANSGAFEISVVNSNVDYNVTLVGGGAAALVTEAAPVLSATADEGKMHKIGITLAATEIDGAAPSGGQAVLTFTGTTLTSEGLSAGDYIQITGWSQIPANDGLYRIVSVDSATQLTVDQLPEDYAADDGTGADFVMYFCEILQNATDRFTYTLQELFTDIGTNPTQTRQVLSGMGANLLSLQIDSEALVNGSLSFVGTQAKYAEAEETAETFKESPGTTPLNSSSDVARIFEGGSSLADVNCVQSMSLEINNNLEKKPCVGKTGGAGFRRGTFSVSGNLTTYFDDKSKVEKVISQVETSLAIGFKDTVNRGYVVDMPRVKLTEGGPSIPGRNDDVIAQLAYTALRGNAPTQYTAKICRFWALV